MARATATVFFMCLCIIVSISPANAVVNGNVVPGGYFNDPRPAVNQFAFVGRWELPNDTCTASLVAPDLVLTAGHCAGKATVRFNMLNSDRDLAPGANVVETRNVVSWKYQSDVPGGLGLGNTLIATLDSPITDITPVGIPDPKADSALWKKGAHLKDYGWGYINPGDSIYTKELRFAEEEVEDPNDIVPPLTGYMRMSSVVGHATHGDSGSPLVGVDGNGHLIQVGVYEGAVGKGHLYYNRLWPQSTLIRYINAHQ